MQENRLLAFTPPPPGDSLERAEQVREAEGCGTGDLSKWQRPSLGGGEKQKTG
jgi:hypothetical protein